MTELKPCPFCGSEKLANYMTSNGATNIYCVDCFEANDGRSINIVAWNTRPIEDELNAKIAQLEQERDILQDKFETLELDYRDVCQKRLEAADSFSKQIIDLTNDRDEWRKDAERLATKHLDLYNSCVHCGHHKYSGMDHAIDCPITLHRQLVAKYGGEK